MKDNKMKKIKLRQIVFLLMLGILTICTQQAEAMLNPSRIYCEEMGYEYYFINETGVCKLGNKQVVNAWDFLKGKTGVDQGYCAKQGLQTKTLHGFDNCTETYAEECAVCVMDNGSEVDVVALMDLPVDESICGDGVCGMPNNYENCPQDCPSGSDDLYCDAVQDDICDQDCVENEDPDCTYQAISGVGCQSITLSPNSVRTGFLFPRIIFMFVDIESIGAPVNQQIDINSDDVVVLLQIPLKDDSKFIVLIKVMPKAEKGDFDVGIGNCIGYEMFEIK